MNSKRKFSLVELMVVMAIIAILVSFLIPTLKRARAEAKSVACMNKLRQMHVAESMWGYDNRPYIIRDSWSAKTWQNELKTYLQMDSVTDSPYICPELEKGSNGKYGFSKYSGNMNQNRRRSAYNQVRRMNVSKPKDAVLFMDANTQSYIYNVFNDVTARRHNGGRNIVFLDGHMLSKVVLNQEFRDPSDPNYWYRWSWFTGR